MTSGQMDGHCYQKATELLQALETRDLAAIETRIQPFRHILRTSRPHSSATPQQDNLLRQEQLELLEAITESVEASLESIRSLSHPHWLRLQTAETLLRHIVEPQVA